MNGIEELRRGLADRLPSVPTRLDAPDDESASWFLDVGPDVKCPWIVVSWKPGGSFGVYRPESDGYGTKPDEILEDVRSVLARLVELSGIRDPVTPSRPY